MRYYVDDDEDTDDDEHFFFRIIFMFVCSKKQANKNKTDKVLQKKENRIVLIFDRVFCAAYAS